MTVYELDCMNIIVFIFWINQEHYEQVAVQIVT